MVTQDRWLYGFSTCAQSATSVSKTTKLPASHCKTKIPPVRPYSSPVLYSAANLVEHLISLEFNKLNNNKNVSCRNITSFTSFYPRDAMHKRGVCYRKAPVCPSLVCHHPVGCFVRTVSLVVDSFSSSSHNILVSCV